MAGLLARLSSLYTSFAEHANVDATDDISTTVPISGSRKPPTVSVGTQTIKVYNSRDIFPFLSLPPELRVMVYRHLLVAKRRIHLDRFLPAKPWKTPGHHPSLYTAVLRVCRQVSAEALPVLYGENRFSVVVVGSHPTVLERHFSEPNRLRLRKLILLHPCWDYWTDSDDLNTDDEELNGNLAAEYDALPDYEAYAFASLRRFTPLPVALNPDIWRPIFENLTILTLRLTAECDGLTQQELDDDIISLSNSENRRRGNIIKFAMSFYDSQLPNSLLVHRQVRCGIQQHRYDVDIWNCMEETEAKRLCSAFRQYLEQLWLGDF